MKFVFAAIIFITDLIGLVQCWGYEGHRMVAQIAAALLPQELRDKFNLFFPDGSDMVSIASWPDYARNRLPWYATSHYTGYPQEGMCHVENIRTYGELLLAINKFSLEIYEDQFSDFIITDKKTERETDKRRLITGGKKDDPLPKDPLDFAARMLVHLIGDAGQLLHFGCACDKGGNQIKVVVPQPDGSHKNKNLHSVWDTYIIQRYISENGVSLEELTTSIIADIHEGQYSRYVSSWESILSDISVMEGDLLIYGNQRAADACTHAYMNENGIQIKSGDVLSNEYLTSSFVNVARRDIASTGVILASVIKMIMRPLYIPQVVKGYNESVDVIE